jgi:hypothetical protein
MQIVINIDEKIYKRVLPYKDLPIISNLCNDYPEITHAIANGVPIPKGHGDLIDRKGLLRLESKWYHLQNGDVACPKIDIDHAPTIIEADRSEES